MKFKTGLIVGKFCPLHKGHQYLIEAALKACEHVVIVSYAKPEYNGCESHKREHWLKTLYPNATRLVLDDEWLKANPSTHWLEVPHDDAPDDTHRNFTAWACFDVLGHMPDAVFTSEDYGDGFCDVLSKYFKVRNSEAREVTHICVDKARTAVPISGTRIRQAPLNYRKFLSDIVYGSFVKRVLVLGAESTGKTTLCAAMSKHLSTQWAQEYGRELWEAKDGNLVYEDLLDIGRAQLKREEDLASLSDKWLICDTSPLTTVYYSQAFFGKIDPDLLRLAEASYDVVFLCDTDIPFVQDNTRQDTSFREHQQNWYKTELEARQIEYTLLSGSVEARMAQMLTKLESCG